MALKPFPYFGALNTAKSTELKTLQAFQDSFQSAYPELRICERSLQHDLLSHVLGGGLITPSGEIFGTIMELVFSTNQAQGYQPTLLKKLLKQKPSLTLPSLELTEKIVYQIEDMLEVRNQLKPEQKLTPQEIKETYHYAGELLSHYISLWGVEAGKNILGLSGYKSDNLVSETIKNRTL